MLLSIILSAAWFSVFVVLHVLWFHLSPPADRFKLIMRLFAAALAGLLLTLFIFYPSPWGGEWELFWRFGVNVLVALTTMGCLFILYMPFYFVIATSLSVQTLNLMRLSPGGVMKIDRLREIFASRAIIAGRLRTMVSNGYLVEDEGAYRLTPKGDIVGRIFRSFKRLWRLGAGG
jgi:hypothetical protein